MWGPKLKYRLEVRGRPLGDVVISVPGSFYGWSPGGFSVVPPTWPASLVATLPLLGVTWRVYATSSTSLWTIASKCGNNAHR
jgi:hypothetical protein